MHIFGTGKREDGVGLSAKRSSTVTTSRIAPSELSLDRLMFLLIICRVKKFSEGSSSYGGGGVGNRGRGPSEPTTVKGREENGEPRRGIFHEGERARARAHRVFLLNFKLGVSSRQVNDPSQL